MNTIDEQNRFDTETGVIATLAPLTVNVPDKRLLSYMNHLESASREHWNGKDINLKARREQNLKYLFGKQLIGKQLKEYESEFIDNIIYEYEAILKSLAVSKMPDVVVEAGGIGGSPDRKQTAELLTKWFEKFVTGDENKQQLGMMFKHMPVYLIAAKKYRWNMSKDENGDYTEEVINPEHLLLDHTAISSNPDEMLYIIHYVEKTGREWAMLFPDKEKEIIEEIKRANPNLEYDEKKDDVFMAQKVRVAECWYDWLDKAENFDPEQPKFEFYSGVCWKLSKTVLLGKSRTLTGIMRVMMSLCLTISL